MIRAALIAIASFLLFAWPFFGQEGPGYAPAFAIVMAAVLGVAAVELGARRLDSRGLALLAALAAVDTVLRVSFPIGIGGFSPFFLLVLCAGFALGPSFGFLCGAFAMLASDVALGALGPWVPYQLLAAGLTGAAAGWAGSLARGRGRLSLLVLAAVGAAMGLVFGAMTDVLDWTTYYRGAGGFGWAGGLAPADAARRFGEFYLATSLAYDLLRSLGNAVLVIALGAPVLAALERFRTRLSFEVVDSQEIPSPL